MKLKSNVISLGKAGLSGAAFSGSEARVLLRTEGGIFLCVYDTNGKKMTRAAKPLSFAEDCWLVAGGRIERTGGLSYVPDKP